MEEFGDEAAKSLLGVEAGGQWRGEHQRERHPGCPLGRGGEVLHVDLTGLSGGPQVGDQQVDGALEDRLGPQGEHGEDG